MSSQSSSNRRGGNFLSSFWTPPPSGSRAHSYFKKEKHRKNRREDIESETLEQFYTVNAFLLELTEDYVSFIMEGSLSVSKVARMYIGNDYELESLIKVTGEVGLDIASSEYHRL